MSVMFVALPVAVILGTLAVLAFVWSARRGQFDDLETPRWRILLDDQRRKP
jgi:cbb3-type cytochrome oxidase maturation protein